MPNELKIVIDADVNKGIQGVQQFGKVFAGEFTKINAAANNLSSDITASVQKINSALSGLKVTSIDVSVDTSSIESSVKSIQSKFASLSDPEINVLADTALAEAKIRELLAELSALKGSEIFIRANDTQAIQVIGEVEAELNNLLDKQINLNINSVDANQKLNLLEKELADLQNLSIQPNISIAQLALFEDNIKRVKAEIATLKGVSVVITPPPIGPVIRSINELEKELADLSQRIDFSKDVNEIARLSEEFRKVQSQINNIRVVGGVSQFDKLGKSIDRTSASLRALPKSSNTATSSLINLGRVVQDAPFGIIGIANNINPLLESFQRLRAESTSTGAALKAFGGSLLGAGGIGLGVSVITSLLTQFALSNRGTKESLEQTAVSVDAVKERQKEFQEAVDKASQSIVNQADKLKDLKAILISTNSEISNITSSTVKQGLAQLLFDKKNVQLQKALTAEIQREIFKRGSIFSTIPEFDPKLFSKNPFDKVVAQADQAVKMINAQSGGLESFFRNIIDPQKVKSETDTLLERMRAFVKEFGEVFVVPDLEVTFTNTEEKVKKAAIKLNDDINKGLLQLKILKDPRQIQIPIELELVPTEKSLKSIRENFFKDVNIGGDNTKIIKGVVPGASEDVAKRNKAFFDAFKQDIITTAGLITDTLSPAFTEMFDAIKNGENPLKAFFSGLVNSINQVIKKLIAAAIQAAVLSALTGGASGSLGGFSKIFSNLLGFSGAANPGGGFGLGGEITGRSFSNVIQIVGSSRVSGNDIVTSYSRATNSSGRFG